MTDNLILRSWKGLDVSRRPVYIDYGMAEEYLKSLVHIAIKFGVESVVGISRGGIVPSSIVASHLGVPLYFVNFDRKNLVTSWMGPQSKEKKVALVDDGCSSGTTLKNAKAWLENGGYSVLTMSIVYDPSVSAFTPDAAHSMTDLWRFPWEIGDATKAARDKRDRGLLPEKSDETPFYGLDLDGVFAEDIPAEEYKRDIEASLKKRDALPLREQLPTFDKDKSMIITGRPEMDRERTEEWLKRVGCDWAQLIMRPPDINDDKKSVAEYKIKSAIENSCTVFIESDPEQCIYMSDIAPFVSIYWWCTMRSKLTLIRAKSKH